MAAYGIVRAEKVKMAKIGKGLQTHQQRESKTKEYNNPDIDPTRAKDNVVLVHSDNFRASVNQKIKEYGITRKIRSDAVGLIDGIIVVSGEFFKGKNRSEVISFFKGILPLVEREFGPVISATIHGDEMAYNDSNWHMHFATVPIIKKGNGYSLSAKDVMGNQKDYIARQDRFYNQYFSKFGLDRGLSAKETHRKHIALNRWKAEQAKQQVTEFQKLSNTAVNTLNTLMLETEQVKVQKEAEVKKADYLQQTNRELDRHISAKHRYIARQNSIVYDDSRIDNLTVVEMLKDGQAPFLLDSINNTDFVNKYVSRVYNQIESDIEQTEQTIKIDNELIAMLESEDYAVE